MINEIQFGAMLRVPVRLLNTNYAELLKLLTVPNPEAKNMAFFGSRFSQNKVPEKLFFFDVDKRNETLLLPRNIDAKYFLPTVRFDYSGLSRGNHIGIGYEASFSLRSHQKDFFDTVVSPYINNYNIKDLLNNTFPLDILMDAECGSGKTIMSLYLAAKYQRKTLIAVTKKAMGNQFITAVKKFFPKWTVGWEDGKHEYDITVATYSLLSKTNYDTKYFSNFGHLIMDEYHRAGASTYQIILSKAPCQYRTTLTATFRRKDGLHKILGLHIGEILSMPRTSRKATIYPILTGNDINEMAYRAVDRTSIKLFTPEEFKLPKSRRDKLVRLEEYTDVCVKHAKSRKELARGTVTSIDYTVGGVSIMVYCQIELQSKTFRGDEVTFHKLGTLGLSAIDTEITEYENRNDIVLELVKSLVADGRKVLILSKRKEVLYKLYKRFKRYGFTSGVVISEKAKDYIDFCKTIGKTVVENREFTLQDAHVVLGIDKLAEEGLDIPHIDTIIFMHPTRDIEQPVGRVTRELENKPCSQAFYLVDNISAYRKMWDGSKGAKSMFKSLGHTVHTEMTLEEYFNKINNTRNGQTRC